MVVTLWAFGLGLVTGWLLLPMPGQRRRRSFGRQGPTVGETLDESLARLTQHQRGVPMKGGQMVMGPQQPRPKVQARVPSAPPRGLPPGMPTHGPIGGPAGQAKAT